MKKILGIILIVAVVFIVIFFVFTGKNNPADNQPQTEEKTIIKIVLLDPRDGAVGKKRGCDTVVYVEKEIPKTTMPLTAAINQLLDIKDVWVGDYYNILGKANLILDKATINDSGIASIYLKGEPPELGGVCDDPRLQIQIEETAFQFSNIKSVEIYINGNLYVAPNLKE